MKISGTIAGGELATLLELARAETTKVIEKNDIPTAVIYFDELRDLVKRLDKQVTELQKHVDKLSYELIPDLFTNANVKSINVSGVGRVTINVRWNASMVDREQGMQWLRESGNGSLIIETVNAQTLGAWAKTETLSGKPPPQNLFKVSMLNFVSITSGA